MEYLIQNLLSLSFNQLTIISGGFIVLLYIIYIQYKKSSHNIFDYKTVIVSTLNYTTNERIDKTIVLKKEKTNNTYLLSLTKNQGYYISFHVCGENIIIGTNIDKKCKPDTNNIHSIPLPDSIRIKIIDSE